eukprot:Blabericola_migrator_1__566@NODE_113_length_13881_cov_115_766396_g101_i0_p5_GENE_NODE_113_length_13881_cov_115_766396_g101_i0NODE_113_length_13881_cov_115_766396_g101_i0_p5_ORF_typecomplete_len138_score31_36_NODE_113_length_13881_cov_115_766396_g101_i023072720
MAKPRSASAKKPKPHAVIQAGKHDRPVQRKQETKKRRPTRAERLGETPSAVQKKKGKGKRKKKSREARVYSIDADSWLKRIEQIEAKKQRKAGVVLDQDPRVAVKKSKRRAMKRKTVPIESDICAPGEFKEIFAPFE